MQNQDLLQNNPVVKLVGKKDLKDEGFTRDSVCASLT